MTGTVTIAFSAIVGPTLRRLHLMIEGPLDQRILEALAVSFSQ